MPAASKPKPSESLDILLPDINGIPRGQRVFGKDAGGILRDGLSWPSSLYAMRFDGEIVEESGMGLRSGDPDYPCRMLPGTFAQTPWRPGGTQAVFEMRKEDGEGFFADPREALRRVLRRLNDDGVYPTVAIEMEFYILKNDGKGNGELHAMDEISRHSRMLDMIWESAEAQKLPVFAALSEDAPGQFEVKLRHESDPLTACLHAILLRRAARECARACGTEATFIAKPLAGEVGSGMHVHVSARTSARGGRHIFADAKTLHSATAGTLAVAREGTAFFAPFANSYRRLCSGLLRAVALDLGE